MPGDKILCLTLVVESNGDGYLARCPGGQGVFAAGDTIEEAIFNCADVVKMIAAYRVERKETLGKKLADRPRPGVTGAAHHRTPLPVVAHPHRPPLLPVARRDPCPSNLTPPIFFPHLGV